MTADDISYWNMIGTWGAATATFLAVVVALLLPKMEINRVKKDAKNNANKLVRAQLLVVSDRLASHLDAVHSRGVLDTPVENISHLPNEVVSSLDVPKLTSLYSLSHELDLAERSRQKAYSLLTDISSDEFQVHVAVYSDWINHLYKKVNELVAEF
ncbi:hypothetical protein ACCF70_004548 [Vibrio parahaemolyticus]|nr:hypothetical protein [Vibrio parahaemolyticus]EJY0899169.1 hypothetical protein [Vibrio parahaemolyticus]EKO5233660.1 hypothetical protein [Vibrio parahaemolyticus]ELA7347862.1 hypothetical protein [Vibrio parahaemolyticus]